MGAEGGKELREALFAKARAAGRADCNAYGDMR